MGTEKITVAGWKGTTEDLQQLLKNGLHITNLQKIGSCWMLEYETDPKVGRPASIDKEQILSMRAAGKSYAAIGKELGCSKTYIIKVCKKQAEIGSEDLTLQMQENKKKLDGLLSGLFGKE